jgi:hypothetical protein
MYHFINTCNTIRSSLQLLLLIAELKYTAPFTFTGYVHLYCKNYSPELCLMLHSLSKSKPKSKSRCYLHSHGRPKWKMSTSPYCCVLFTKPYHSNYKVVMLSSHCLLSRIIAMVETVLLRFCLTMQTRQETTTSLPMSAICGRFPHICSIPYSVQ